MLPLGWNGRESTALAAALVSGDVVELEVHDYQGAAQGYGLVQDLGPRFSVGVAGTVMLAEPLAFSDAYFDWWVKKTFGT